MQHIVVLMGGTSLEHGVSMVSGGNAVRSLDRSKYQVTPVVVDLDGRWQFDGAAGLDVYDAVGELKRRGVDCVFVALHGTFGEDGRLQGMLDLLGIPYTCSGCAASALAMDKIRSKAVVKAAGVRVAEHVVFTAAQLAADYEEVAERVAKLGFPCVVKSPCQGSSFGMAIPQSADEFQSYAADVAGLDGRAMAEQYVHGTEVTCGVLDVEEGQRARALPVTEIRPITASYYDFEAKYMPGGSSHVVPAEISTEAAAQVQEMAVKAHEAAGCRFWSRSDFIIGPQGPVWIEVNTVPGMTQTSLFPEAAAVAGIPFEELMNMLVEAALRSQKAKG